MKEWIAAIALKLGLRGMAVSLIGEKAVEQMESGQGWFG